MDLTPEELTALGLPVDATREQISAAILGRTTASDTTPETDGNPDSQPEAPADDPAGQPATAPEGDGDETETETETETEGTETAQVNVPEGMVLVDAATMEELREGNQIARQIAAERAAAERDKVLDDAIRAGKFPKARRKHYETMLSADPEGTKTLLSTMAPGLVPTGERGLGVAASAADTGENETAYPTGWRKQVEASRRSIGDRVKVVQD